MASTAEAQPSEIMTSETAAVNGNVQASPVHKKLHGRAFYESIGSPKHIVAPMVDQSEYAWRLLSRSFLPLEQRSSILAYTPMLHARLFVESPKYRATHFQPLRGGVQPPKKSKSRSPSPSASPSRTSAPPPDLTPATWYLDGHPTHDRPLIVQFCANDPTYLLAAARLVAPYCDAVDLNLGCPQGIARKGRYGAFLQEDQDLIYKLINTLHRELPIPVTAKIRVLDTPEATLAYARNVLSAGASFLTVHGRRREQKGHLTGLADWGAIRRLREELPAETVLFANGNVLQTGDVERVLRATGADGVMSAEGNLSDPGIFAPVPVGDEGGREYWRGRDGKGGWRVDAVMRRYLDILHEHVLGRTPPERKPLFVPGDEDTSLLEEPAKEEDEEDEAGAGDGEEEGPPRKKVKREKNKKFKRSRNGPRPTGKAEIDPDVDPAGANFIAVKAHLFHLLRHFVSRHHDVRDAVARSRSGDMAAYEAILTMVERKVAAGLVEYERTDGKSLEESEAAPINGAEAEAQPEKVTSTTNGAQPDAGMAIEDVDDTESSVAAVNRCKRPWWVAQPIVRPLPKEAIAKGAISLSKKDQAKLKDEELQDKISAQASGVESAPEEENTKNGELKSLEKETNFSKSELVSG